MGRGYYAGRRAAKRHYYWNTRKRKSRTRCSPVGQDDSFVGMAMVAMFVTISFLELTGLSRMINPIIAGVIVGSAGIVYDGILCVQRLKRRQRLLERLLDK